MYRQPDAEAPAVETSYELFSSALLAGTDLDRFRREADVVSGGPDTLEIFTKLFETRPDSPEMAPPEKAPTVKRH